MTMYIAISILGLGCATIYSSSIGYATLLVEHPSPRIVSYIITSSGVGTYLAQVYSSYVEAHYGIPIITTFSAGFMILAIILYVIVAFNDKIAIKHM
jgi:MFS family permease